MRIANIDGRATIVVDDHRGIDIARASAGRFGPGLPQLYTDWSDFLGWQQTAVLPEADVAFDAADLGCPSPAPQQVIAVGLNYSAHASESGFDLPEDLPPTFTKFRSCLAGPEATVQLPRGGNTDWEVELVVVMGREAHHVSDADSWEYVAGLSVGQDISERISQLAGPAPQFSLGKSFPNFGPVGPWLVTPDELADRDNLELGCAIDGETVQLGRTKDLIFPVSTLIARLSQTITLYPGDVIFSGTPDGVGLARTPQRFLRPGEKLVSWIEGIGSIHQTFVE
ncbi:fumarylacetoacetate hydrolase family protein [Rhodococcus sp. ACPA1]|uniref:fumarylacetoacetate hydrolase family protein n=1 Tax=Rhodococcus sp. ACPA1 TaxID=2028572 RepID=UPI000BB10FD8|nr:fumarylacetoacetate hydrolase family protein [Rhodococcus sp. ACPA1]PBC47179.1 fumarylacetoacetate hydrolase [Rhodococcus sp. ACPA1]